jgi:glycosyltransferase involved in cell wall biosynthesis
MKNNKKLKILVCSESSKVSSGFGVYNKFLLNGLYNAGKYDIAEFASYGVIGDKEKFNIPWKYYPNAVVGNDPRFTVYNSSTENHFGRWRFDRVVLDYKPDVVIDVRDYWMNYYQGKSPFRKYFHWILMPTVDSFPQKEEWLDTFIDADAIFTYSDWARDVLNDQTCGAIKYIATTSPGVDLENFNVILPNTFEIKKALRIEEDCIIIGTVMRNQKRKLFPELIRAFEKIVEKVKTISKEKADKLILYLHTSYPDAGWDMAELIKSSKVGNKILFTYACKNCGAVFASPFSGHAQQCYMCNQKSALIPNVSNGIDDKILSKIIGSFDAYVQYSICEGFGMPQVEAAGCGVPVFSVNYSAMEDIVDRLNATPVDIGAYFKELETSAIRVYPDESDFVDKLTNFILKPEQMRRRQGFDIRKLTEQQYSWTNTLEKWEKYLDSVELKSPQGQWHIPTRKLNKINLNTLPKLNNIYELAYFLHNEYLSELNLSMSSYWVLKQIQTAQDGYMFSGPEPIPFTVENLVNNINQLIENYNIAEAARTNPNILEQEDYIQYANQ